MVEGNLLMTSNGTEIVRYFGREVEVLVPKKVETLRKSCFEGSHCVERVVFEDESRLLRICRSALAYCSSLRSISLPASVEVIEEAAFELSTGLESCLIEENAHLQRIEREAFSECRSLRSFYVPLSVDSIGENCFNSCISLRRLKFASDKSLNRFVGDSPLDEAFENLGLYEISSVLRIEVGDRECILDCQDDRLMLMKVSVSP
jgi:hypothetical protein